MNWPGHLGLIKSLLRKDACTVYRVSTYGHMVERHRNRIKGKDDGLAHPFALLINPRWNESRRDCNRGQ